MIGKWYGKKPRPSGKAGEYDDYDILMRCDIWWDYAPGVSAGREWPSFQMIVHLIAPHAHLDPK